ncbi:MAG: pyridoxal phosphate-dependent aminotransferase [Myxococcota bacterium]|nr:pyridoxal phosphate-dependent aminotransferase [Myxococcota bacterium]
MFGPTRYLEWARRLYGTVRYDLATSGAPTVPRSEMGVPDAARLDDPSGPARLREAIAAYNAVPLQEAMAALGTTHGLWLAYAVLTSPGDDVLVESPVYEPLVRTAEGVGAHTVSFTRDARTGFAIDPERVARAMTPRTRVIALTNLHNPSGVRASDEQIRDIARVAASQRAYLLVDEVYAPFDEMVDASGVFAGSARRLGANIVAVSSLTKCYGLGPERIGWLLGPADVISRAEDAVTASCGMLPLAHANMAIHAFGQIGALAARTSRLLGGKRERVAAWAESEGLEWSAPVEGLFGFVTVPGAGDLTPLIERTARDREVLVAPGAFFGVANGFRVAWSAPVNALDEGLARLGAGLREEAWGLAGEDLAPKRG